MKTIKQILKSISFTSLVFTIFLVSCEKEHTSNQFNPYYRLIVNGNLKKIDACGSSSFVAEYLRDTAVFAAFGCAGVRAGFYLKGKISDGTYLLDNKNSAWFDEGGVSYATDSLNKGSLIIKSGNFQAAGGLIPFVEGTLSFDAIDKRTGQKVKVTDGKFFLKKSQY